jgi:hypothetical protein
MAKPVNVAAGGGKYCSRMCYHQAIRPPQWVDVACARCGVLFRKKHDAVAIYCSAQCIYETRFGDVADRFWSYVKKSDGCWLWTAHGSGRGYGRFRIHAKYHVASRVSWQLHYGAIPDGLLVCHHCDNPTCVRPDHLFLGTNKDNIADCLAKGRRLAPKGSDHWMQHHPERIARGIRSGSAKLDDAKVQYIRTLYAKGGVSHAALGKRMGVSSSLIGLVVRKEIWAHVPDVDRLTDALEAR